MDKLKPMKWDGSYRGAERILMRMPDRTISMAGGAPGIPIELRIQTKRGRAIKLVKPGQLVGVDANGNGAVVRRPRS